MLKLVSMGKSEGVFYNDNQQRIHILSMGFKQIGNVYVLNNCITYAIPDEHTYFIIILLHEVNLLVAY